MPPLHIIIGSYGLAIYTSVLWGEHGSVDPVGLDVFVKFFQGLHGCFYTQSLKNAGNLLVRDEEEGHQSPDVAVGPLVADVCARQTKRLNLSDKSCLSDLLFITLIVLCPFSSLLTGLSQQLTCIDWYQLIDCFSNHRLVTSWFKDGMHEDHPLCNRPIFAHIGLPGTTPGHQFLPNIFALVMQSFLSWGSNA